MEAFTGLKPDKQEKIVNAALTCFGSSGYKKASVSDIASAAGISKAMVFHYFGTKKDLYLYLVNRVGNFMVSELEEALPRITDPNRTDFFERIRFSTKIKIALMKKHPAILSFVNSMYNEQDPEVRPEINKMLAKGEEYRRKIAFHGIDSHKFKEGIDPAKMMKMLTWMAEGYISEYPANAQYDLDELVSLFDEYMEIMRRNFYKEEYL